MKRIVHLIHGLNTGGAETLVKNYCLGLDKSKYKVTVLCYQRLNSPYDRILADAGIEVLYACDRMKMYGKKGFIAEAVNDCQLLFVFRKMLRELNPDILHTHLTLNIFVMFAGLSSNTQIFHTIHNQINVLWPRFSIIGNADLLAAKWLVKHRGMRLITLYENMKREADALFKVNNSVVLNNGICFSDFEHAKDKMTMRNELKIPQDAFIVGHVGRFSKQKNHEFLVDVFEEIYKHNDKAFLLMVGSGKNLDLIKAKLDAASLQDRFLILSDRSDIADIMSAMDVFVFPSIYEGLGIALIEAQKSGLACLVSDAITNAAKVTDLVKMLSLTETPKKWAEEALNYRQIQSEAAANGNNQVPSDWNMTNVIRKLEQLYEGEI